jgi:replicative DNA helicase
VVHTSTEAATEGVKWAEHILTTPGVKFGVPCVDAEGAMNAMHPGDMTILCGRPGAGKCFAPGTMVLMFDGTERRVESILVGDQLMGPDSTPRTVISLGHGYDDMYEIVPVKGDPYTVNSDHILTLQMSGYNNHPTGMVVDLTVKEYLTKSDKFKSKAKGYRVGVEWESWPVPIEPYFVGVWLGDGDKNCTRITSVDEPIIEYLRDYARRLKMNFSIVDVKDRCKVYNIVGIKGAKNPIRENLRNLGLFGHKDFIPHIYKINDRQVRLELLAGLIDSDGTYDGHNLSITQKSKQLSNDIAFLCRSLGFAAYIHERQCTCHNTGVTGTYYRVSISGELTEIPTRLIRKQPTPRKQCKSVLRTGITVNPAGKGHYYGFEIAGTDRRFLLADFTVVHNTAMLATLARIEARRIIAAGKQKEEAVFYVTWEQVTEEINMILDVNDAYTATDIMRGRASMDDVIAQSLKRAMLPIWLVGDSMARTGTHSLRMFPDVVFGAIESAVDEYGVKPTLLCFDYIQLVPVRDAKERVSQVGQAAVRCKEVAKRVGCPAIVGAQARREVDDREFKLPGTRDAQWASAVEQATDKFFGLWRPWLTDKGKDPIKVGDKEYEITEDLLILEMSKQRFGPAGHRWGLHFQPQHLEICEYELRHATPEGLGYDY